VRKAPGGGYHERRAGSLAKAQATASVSPTWRRRARGINVSRVAVPGEGLGGGGPLRIGARNQRPTYRVAG
jgi:hypothetical protein